MLKENIKLLTNLFLIFLTIAIGNTGIIRNSLKLPGKVIKLKGEIIKNTITKIKDSKLTEVGSKLKGPKLNSIGILKSHNYTTETHTVTTSDGFILTMFRIPPREPKENAPIVFMQHGMTATSDIYLLNGPNNGLAYMLADVGYDVWLGNARGTRYGRRHTKLSPKMKEFWQFSWHEIGTIDVPESIDHVLKLTGQDAVHYVGHSQGGTTYLVMISMKPEYNQKMKTVSLLAPAVYMKGLKLPKVLTTYLTARGDAEFMPSRTLLKTIEPLLCDVNNKVCSKLYFLTGRDSDATNRTILPLLLATHPGGASTRQPLHYWQLSKSDNFAQFDFGETENQKRYGQEKPPEYKLSNINKKAWISIFYGKNDERVSKSSIMRLQKQLHRPIMNEMPKGWNHLDFVIANDVKEHVNIPIIQKANGYENRHKGRKNKKKKKEVANNTETES